MLPKLILVATAYLMGSIPFGYLLVKFVFTSGEDVRRVGSGGTGATNVARRAGRAAGLLTYSLDFGKGLAAVLLMRLVADGDYLWVGSAAIAAMLGHIFPIFLGFRGGKGVATGAGAFLALAPYSLLSALVIWALAVYFTRYVSLASIIASVTIPLWTLFYYGWLQPSTHVRALVITGVVGCVAVVAKHHENIKRLLNHTESKIGQKVGPPETNSIALDQPATGRGRVQ